MKVLFQNHSSLLIEHNGNYLLTDPWLNQPAFGSWLPTFPAYLHPAYIAALGNKLTILVSHGHDDHFDDKLLGIFDKDTRIITADFKAPSVLNRLRSLGLNNVDTVGIDEKLIDGFHVSSYIVEDFSHDDAGYLITTEDGAVIHANDNWHEFTDEHERIISERVSVYPENDILLFSQTNSASGFPLNYDIFSEEEQNDILSRKVAKMVEGGLRNAEKLNLQRMFSYAGFATPYVCGENYHQRGFFPTASFLKGLLDEVGIKSSVEIEELYPGDYIELPGGSITKAFVNDYRDAAIKEKAHTFYETYDHIDECISFKEVSDPGIYIREWLNEFLMEFEDFSVKRVNGLDIHYTELLGKTFKMTVNFENEEDFAQVIEFGKGFVEGVSEANKECIVDSRTMNQILLGNALFEDLYTGYNAKWKRHPSDQYNRDIVMMIVMFSYVYKNRLAESYIDKYSSPA